MKSGDAGPLRILGGGCSLRKPPSRISRSLAEWLQFRRPSPGSPPDNGKSIFILSTIAGTRGLQRVWLTSPRFRIGIDGQWSAFALRTGTPGQLSQVLPSSAVYTTWLVGPIGCKPTPQTAKDCPQSRGGLYNHWDSRTWHEVGNYSTVVEAYLNPQLDVVATFGLDTISLGASNDTAGTELQSQVVAFLGANTFYNGVFGLNHQASNFSTLSDPQPSFINTLKSQSLIPSLSYGYTAGASYRKPNELKFDVWRGLQRFTGNSLASLTFGGYDASRFQPNNVSFTMTGDTTFDLVLALKSIKTTTANGTTLSVLSTPTRAFIDTTKPHMYLPPDACQIFAQAFNLQWVSEFGLYLIDPETHANNTAKNPSITFTLADLTSGGSTTDIVLPYASFDLTATFPYVPETMRYFPLRPAHNASQVILGRAFFQETYVVRHRN